MRSSIVLLCSRCSICTNYMTPVAHTATPAEHTQPCLFQSWMQICMEALDMLPQVHAQEHGRDMEKALQQHAVREIRLRRANAQRQFEEADTLQALRTSLTQAKGSNPSRGTCTA